MVMQIDATHGVGFLKVEDPTTPDELSSEWPNCEHLTHRSSSQTYTAGSIKDIDG